MNQQKIYHYYDYKQCDKNYTSIHKTYNLFFVSSIQCNIYSETGKNIYRVAEIIFTFNIYINKPRICTYTYFFFIFHVENIKVFLPVIYYIFPTISMRKTHQVCLRYYYLTTSYEELQKEERILAFSLWGGGFIIFFANAII